MKIKYTNYAQYCIYNPYTRDFVTPVNLAFF